LHILYALKRYRRKEKIMSDDLGRGMLDWPAERWVSLDAVATDAVMGSVVLRNLLEYREQPDARTVRIAGQDIPVVQVQQDFNFDMQNDDIADLERRIQLIAQDLAVAEDTSVLGVMDLQNPQPSPNLLSAQFIRAKNALRNNGVQQGFGVVVSTDALSELEIEARGVRSGLEFIERVIGTTVAQSNGLPYGANNAIHAVLFQASPAAFQMVHAYGPRIRVMGVQGGTIVNLRLEEGIAVGELTPNRCLGIQLQPQ
jgi:hypothetical protein